MMIIYSYHFVAQQLHTPIGTQSYIPGSESAMHLAFAMDQVHGSQHAGTEDRPDFLLGEGMAISGSVGNFLLQRIVGVLKNQDNLMEGGAEGIFGFSSEMQEVEYMLVFVG